jgi:hypothetical protein
MGWAAWGSQLGGVCGVGQMNSIRQESVVKLAERFGTLHLEVGVDVMLEVQVTDTKVSTRIATVDM